MSKSAAFIIATLAGCLGLFIGILVMSSDVENFKKEKKQAEIARKKAEANQRSMWETQLTLKAELNKVKSRKNELVREITALKEELSEVMKANTAEKGQLQKDSVTVAQEEHWKEVAKWTGKGIKTTEIFHISSRSWRVIWVTKPTTWSGNSNFQIYVYSSDGNLHSVAANVIGEDKNSSVIHESGKFYLTINTDQSYVISVLTPTE
jgi:hypothetical protein